MAFYSGLQLNNFKFAVSQFLYSFPLEHKGQSSDNHESIRQAHALYEIGEKSIHWAWNLALRDSV